ncbi:MAG: ABC transporter ATP-binding protein [bacterium]
MPPEWHTDHHSGDTIDKIEKGTSSIYRFASQGFEVVETIMMFVGSYIALAYFNFHTSYIVLFMVILTVTLILKIDKVLIRQYKELNTMDNEISAKVFDVISNITTVIILRVEDLVSKAIFKKITKPFRLFSKNVKINETKWFAVSICTSTMLFLTLLSYILINVKAGQVVLIGTIYALYGYIERINNLFFRFAYRYGDIVRQRTKVMNAEEISKEFKDKEKINKIRLSTGWHSLKIENLNFAYDNQEGQKLHLCNVSLLIKKGEHIALIGESGSGKTTLLKIIRELYTPDKVKVYLDGKLLSGGFKPISHDIALIPQDPEIFSTTIKENITLGVSHKLSHIKKYTDLARFTNVIERLPKKINSSIVEKGVNLSGGEKQRLALSRGLMACEDKAIILLDEPTSSVDLQNEMAIYENIFSRFKNQAVISSIHRLHLLPLFDQIYLFSNGRITASGSFPQLLKKSPEFREMWNKYNQVKYADLA